MLITHINDHLEVIHLLTLSLEDGVDCLEQREREREI